MRFSWLFPRSTLGLVAMGFLLVSLPLVIVSVTAALGIDRQAIASFDAAQRANETTRLARGLGEHILAMERALGQYAVLGDESFRATYQTRRSRLLASLTSIESLHQDAALQDLLSRFRVTEQEIFDTHQAPSDPAIRQLFETLAMTAAKIETTTLAMVEADISRAAHDALALQHMLLVLTLAALPISLVLAILFSTLITKPIRQVDAAIRRLAADSSGGPIEIEGPRDLREVGEVLDLLGQRMQDLERQQLNFVRRISHEVKTPLTTIRQGAELLADPAGTSPGETVEIGSMMRESSLELQRLIEDLLEFGRTQRITEQHPGFGQVDLGELTGQVLAGQSLALKSRDIHLETSLENCTVAGDPRQLRTIIGNLVANAIKFTPPGGMLTVTTGSRESEGVVDVIDTGPGIPDSERHLIFQPFHQGQPTPGAHVKGTGLGLAIAKDYAEAHHGCIELLNPSRGAHFRVRVPLA